SNPFLGAVWGNGQPIFWPTPNNEWDLAFELVTADTSVVGAKWEQPPDLGQQGIDINATRQSGAVPPPTPPYLLADDFPCVTPGFITNIVIWGSWTNDVLPVNPQSGIPDATNVT